jgi:hypothetical protein
MLIVTERAKKCPAYVTQTFITIKDFEVLRAATEDYYLKVPTFQRDVLLPSSWWKIKLSLERNDHDIEKEWQEQ